jgi:hypothetical protein
MYWLLAPAAFAALALYWIGNRAVKFDGPTDAPAPPAATSAPPPSATRSAAAPSLSELSDRAASTLEGIKTALAGITDEATAKSTMPKLQDAVSQIERIKTSAADLPADGRGQLAAMVAAALPQISESIDRVMGIPGVGALLKPILDQLVTTLTRLSTK